VEENLTQHHGKTYKAIMNLPEQPVTWVCYNDDMIPYYEKLIAELRGTDWADKYLTVISTGAGRMYDRVHLDPVLHDLKGNGYD
jgi:hypothetical protein